MHDLYPLINVLFTLQCHRYPGLASAGPFTEAAPLKDVPFSSVENLRKIRSISLDRDSSLSDYGLMSSDTAACSGRLPQGWLAKATQW